MLAGARMYLEEPKLQADGIYTYGQPRTCDRVLAAAYNKGLKDRAFRFVNNNDIVPQMPPEPVFTHAEGLRYIDSDGKLHSSMSLLGGLTDRAKGLTADPFAPASDASATTPSSATSPPSGTISPDRVRECRAGRRRPRSRSRAPPGGAGGIPRCGAVTMSTSPVLGH